MRYLNKLALYHEVDKIRNDLGFGSADRAIRVEDHICEHLPSIEIREMEFSTRGLHGIVQLGSASSPRDLIILDVNRAKDERNFDCAHELMHTCLHRSGKSQSFYCYNEAKPNQDRYLEWQANEGGAELLIPYIRFLSIIGQRKNELCTFPDYVRLIYQLSREFSVTPTVVQLRMHSLTYEIYQHIHGTPVDQVTVLSKCEQEKRGLGIRPLEEIEMELYDRFDLENRNPISPQELWLPGEGRNWRRRSAEGVRFPRLEDD